MRFSSRGVRRWWQGLRGHREAAGRGPAVESLEARRMLALLNFAVSDAVGGGVWEGNGAEQRYVVFNITLSGLNATQTVSVRYATVGGTAQAGADYVHTTGSVVFRAGSGQRSAQVAVPVISDTTIEPAQEQFKLVLSNPIGAGISRAEGIGIIADDDTPVISVRAIDRQAAEAYAEPGTFRFTRTNGTRSRDLVVRYSVLGTATNGEDYETLTGSVTIPKGKSFVDVVLTPINDADAEGDETVQVRLRDGSRYDLDPSQQRRRATITILDRETVEPTAALAAKNVKEVRAAPFRFNVIYSDETLLNARTIGSGDITVTGPNGYSARAQLVSKTPAGNAGTIVATYRIPGPGGSWDALDNGFYTVTVAPDQVLDKAGNAVAGGALGGFSCRIPTGLAATAAPAPVAPPPTTPFATAPLPRSEALDEGEESLW